MSMRLGGWIPDPKNVQYEKWQPPLGGLPSSFYEIPVYTPVSNQKHRPSCVGNAVADMFEILYGIKYGKEKVKQFSRRFVWSNARAAIGRIRDENSGCYIKDAMYSLSTAGICLEETFPYDVSDDECRKWPTDEAYKEGDSNKINSYYKLKSNNDMVPAITSNNPIVCGVIIGRDFMELKNKVFIGESRPEGGHAILVTGYDPVEDLFKIRNSWGTDWGNEGYCMVDGNWLRNNAIDSWVATGIKEFA